LRITFYHIITFLALALTGSSCSPEWKLSKAYVALNPEPSIMLLPVDYVFKSNLKKEEIKDYKKLDEWELDSALFENSFFLKDISDSIFLETYINSMIEEFEKLSFHVFTEASLDTFLFLKSNAFILNFAQLELEEYYTKHEDQEEFGEYIYHKELYLNAVNMNFWFEFSRLNPQKGGRKVFFNSQEIADDAYGYFSENIFTGEVKYKYFLREMELEDIYRYCEILGARHASYTYDYLMNVYIANNFPSHKRRKYYMHYDRQSGTFDPAKRQRFIITEE